MTSDDFEALTNALVEPVLEAGRVEMSYFGSDLGVATKADESPVTEADHRAEEILIEALERAAPGIPIVAEECASRGEIPRCEDELFLVDPLDGTRGFIKGRPEFTINIGYVREGQAEFGLIYAPALAELFVTLGAQEAACVHIKPDAAGGSVRTLQPKTMATRSLDRKPLRAVSSRYVSKALTRRLAALEAERIDLNSSLKFCRIADGSAHIYPRFGEISEWDTAAGAALVKAAGGTVTDLDGNESRYGKSQCGFRNEAFIAWSTPEPPPDLLAALTKD
ncbi:MAG: 3'(2'),5'-bisphosphate nucleotidase CysQ [Pseudomonadota bacterium]